MDRPIRYAETPPPSGLASAVRDLWRFDASPETPAGTFTLPPDPCASLAVVARGPRLGLRVVGPHLWPISVPLGPGTVVCGIRLRPELAGPLLGDAAAWLGHNADAGDVLPELTDSARRAPDVPSGQARVLGALPDRLRRAPAPDPLVRRAVDAIEAARGELRIGALAAELGVSARTLQRRFGAATGLAPKPYARVRRFLLAAANVLRAAPEAWGRVAAEHGFADQAHFGRECVALTGLAPGAFAARMAPILHVGVRP